MSTWQFVAVIVSVYAAGAVLMYAIVSAVILGDKVKERINDRYADEVTPPDILAYALRRISGEEKNVRTAMCLLWFILGPTVGAALALLFVAQAVFKGTKTARAKVALWWVRCVHRYFLYRRDHGRQE